MYLEQTKPGFTGEMPDAAAIYQAPTVRVERGEACQPAVAALRL